MLLQVVPFSSTQMLMQIPNPSSPIFGALRLPLLWPSGLLSLGRLKHGLSPVGDDIPRFYCQKFKSDPSTNSLSTIVACAAKGSRESPLIRTFLVGMAPPYLPGRPFGRFGNSNVRMSPSSKANGHARPHDITSMG